MADDPWHLLGRHMLDPGKAKSRIEGPRPRTVILRHCAHLRTPQVASGFLRQSSPQSSELQAFSRSGPCWSSELCSAARKCPDKLDGKDVEVVLALICRAPIHRLSQFAEERATVQLIFIVVC